MNRDTLYTRLLALRDVIDAHDIVSRIEVDELLEVIDASNELGAFVVTLPVNPNRLNRLRAALVKIGAKAS